MQGVQPSQHRLVEAVRIEKHDRLVVLPQEPARPRLEQLLERADPTGQGDETQTIIWCNDTYAEFLSTTKDKVLAQQKEIAAQTIKKKAA